MSDDHNSDMSLVFGYLKLRKTLGILGIAFPFLLVFGSWIYAGMYTGIESSISYYYHTVVKHVFGGVLFVVAFFMFAYRGYAGFEDSFAHCGFPLCKIRLKDNVAGNLACFFAIGVVLFPTNKKDFDGDFISTLHFIFAGLLFLCLVYFSLCLFTRSKSEVLKDRKKIWKNRTYKICGYLMLLCIILVPVFIWYFDSAGRGGIDQTISIFVLETIALEAFGISWLVKGLKKT